MPKNINWQKPHSNTGDMPLKEFRDPMTGKRLNSIGEPRDESFAKPVRSART